jgi:hypothetical protein
MTAAEDEAVVGDRVARRRRRAVPLRKAVAVTHTF